LDLKDIKELMDAMKMANIKRLSLKNGGDELELEAQGLGIPLLPAHAEETATKTFSAHETSSQISERPSDIPTSLQPPLEASESSTSKKQGHFITSPMVGTFYLSPGPNEASFVKLGEPVTKETVVCIIEAMKVMNEVKAGSEGVVKEILVESGHPVEFGTNLFRIG